MKPSSQSFLQRLGLLCAAILFAGPAFAAGDVAKGQASFQSHCAICHTAEKGAGNRIGPDLFGIVGSKAAAVPGFSFSPAMQKSGIVWTPAKLDAWITQPSKLVPGTRMAFAGISDPKERADLIAFLATKK